MVWLRPVEMKTPFHALDISSLDRAAQYILFQQRISALLGLMCGNSNLFFKHLLSRRTEFGLASGTSLCVRTSA